MSITVLPSPPSTNDPASFATKADALLAALPGFVIEVNATAAAMNLNATTDTSASSIAIGTGAKSFTVSTGKSFQPGMWLVIADAAAPSTNQMIGTVTSYDAATGALVMNIVAVLGSGTKTAWSISQSSSGGAIAGPIATSGITGAVEKSGGTMTGALGIVAGSASAPGLYISGDIDTGIAQLGGLGTLDFVGNGARRGGFDAPGNFTAGTTSSRHAFAKAEGQGAAIFSVDNATAVSLLVYSANGSFSAAPAGAIATNSNASNGRSINSPGTINASGADYAEYERKSRLGDVFKKGEIVGFNSDGLLTKVFAESVRFGIKTTNPNLVGGDAWGPDASLMPVEPKRPCVYWAVGTSVIRSVPTDMAILGTKAAEEYLEHWRQKDEADKVASREYDVAMEVYTADLANFRALQEAERQWMDRIAYCGKVPCNVYGAKPGQYISVKEGPNGEIVGESINRTALRSTDRLHVGVVGRILPDGRAEVVVMGC